MEVRGTLYILKDIREYGVKANTSSAPAGTAAAPSATPQWHLPSAGKAGALGGGAGGGPEEEKKEEEATATACREHPLEHLSTG